MRKLKFHEQKLLKKVDFLNWKKEQNLREIKVLRRYHITNREDYHKYNKIAGMVTQLVSKIKDLPSDDEFRAQITEQLLQKLYRLGLVPKENSLSQCNKLAASAFCRRRLPVVMVRLNMAESVSKAVQFIEHGHVRIGPEVIRDPALLVTRNMEDFISWVDTSKMRKHIMKYSDKLDDYDLLQP